MRNLLSLVTWLRNVSISKKLYFTVGLMGMLIIIELATLSFAINALSSVRALVGADGFGSTAHKNAAYSLQKFGHSRNEADYKEYLSFLKVPMGDHKTRLELLKASPDFQVAREGFLRGPVYTP